MCKLFENMAESFFAEVKGPSKIFSWDYRETNIHHEFVIEHNETGAREEIRFLKMKNIKKAQNGNIIILDDNDITYEFHRESRKPIFYFMENE